MAFSVFTHEIQFKANEEQELWSVTKPHGWANYKFRGEMLKEMPHMKEIFDATCFHCPPYLEFMRYLCESCPPVHPIWGTHSAVIKGTDAKVPKGFDNWDYTVSFKQMTVLDVYNSEPWRQGGSKTPAAFPEYSIEVSPRERPAGVPWQPEVPSYPDFDAERNECSSSCCTKPYMRADMKDVSLKDLKLRLTVASEGLKCELPVVMRLAMTSLAPTWVSDLQVRRVTQTIKKVAAGQADEAEMMTAVQLAVDFLERHSFPAIVKSHLTLMFGDSGDEDERIDADAAICVAAISGAKPASPTASDSE